MNKCTVKVKLLSTGYLHARWNDNQWIQWPNGEIPTKKDCFGWVSKQMLEEAFKAAEIIRSKIPWGGKRPAETLEGEYKLWSVLNDDPKQTKPPPT